MQNKKMLEHSPEENHAMRLQEMKDIRDDDSRRLAYLRRQAMFESLNDAKKVI
jgi:predicted DNA-binding protein (UPF0251 family)